MAFYSQQRGRFYRQDEVERANMERRSDTKPRKKMKMGASWNDYLRYQYGAAKATSAIESLPFELLEPILDEVHFNSVGGLQAFARSSRLCRALANPYFYRPIQATFNELTNETDPRFYVTVTLYTLNDGKTLGIKRPETRDSTIYPNVPQTIESVLRGDDSFRHLRCLPESEPPLNLATLSRRCMITPQSLELINHCCPLLSKLTLGLEWISDYCTSDGLPVPPAYPTNPPKPLDTIPRLPALNHLELHFKISTETLELMHPSSGRLAAHTLFTLIQSTKQGVPLAHLDLVLYATTYTIFGFSDYSRSYFPVHPRLDVIMTCRLPSNPKKTSSTDNQNLITSCNLPIIGRMIDRKRQVEWLVDGYPGRSGWREAAGPRTWRRVQKKWPNPSRTSLLIAKATTLPSAVARGMVVRLWELGGRMRRRAE